MQIKITLNQSLLDVKNKQITKAEYDSLVTMLKDGYEVHLGDSVVSIREYVENQDLNYHSCDDLVAFLTGNTERLDRIVQTMEAKLVDDLNMMLTDYDIKVVDNG